MKHPAWLNEAIFYEVYPQSFKDTNADGIGDIPGIIEKLDYIHDLGCNAIWINPCFASPFGDAGYDVADYYSVAPRYGTNEDLKRLFAEAHNRNMHVILDLVPGHTSVEHPWFRESMKGRTNKYTDRYIWTNSVWEEPEGFGCIRGFSERNGSCVVNYFSNQPALNYGFQNPVLPWQQPTNAPGPRATVEELKKIMHFWLSMGCDGFRVDMANSLVKNDPDSIGAIALWQEIRSFLDDTFPDAVMVSEWGEPDKSLEAGFHMDFLLHFGSSHYNDLFRCEAPFFSAKGTGDASAFVAKYRSNYEAAGRKGLICIPSGNHDMDRLARSLHGDCLKVAFAFLLSMPGAPFIYYGDEIGMRYIEDHLSVEGGYNRTGSRSPMQWDHSVNAGFSAAPEEKLYIRMDGSADRPTVAAQMADRDSLYHVVKQLIAIRQAHKALQNTGEIDFIYAEKNAYPLAYLRTYDDEQILIMLNPSDREVSFHCSFIPVETIYRMGGNVSCHDETFTIAPQTAAFLKVQHNQ